MPPFRVQPPSVLDVLISHDDVAGAAAPPARSPVVDCAVYLGGVRQPHPEGYRGALEEVRRLRAAGAPAFVWLGLHEPDETEMNSVAATFGLHPIPVEDAVRAQQRPKVQRYDDTLFVVLKTVNYVPHESLATPTPWWAQEPRIVETGEVMIFVASEFVVAVRHGRHTGLAGLRTQLEAERSRLASGPFAVVHAIADHVVETYLEVAAQLERDIDEVEEQIFSPRARTDIEPIYTLKRDVLRMRRAIGPLTTALQRLSSDFTDLLPAEAQRYIRDVLDHQMQAAERIVGYDDMLSSLVQAALARVGTQQNVDMRRISAWVAIAAVPTMIAGIYGMNFQNMPELDARWGYPAVLGLMATICLLLYLSFRRNNWL